MSASADSPYREERPAGEFGLYAPFFKKNIPMTALLFNNQWRILFGTERLGNF